MKKLLPFLFAIVVQGCATIEPFTLNENDKVAIAINLSNTLSTSYRGFTVFTNEEGLLPLELERTPEIVNEINHQKSKHTVVLDEKNVIAADYESALKEAAEKGYSYLLYISDGRVCMDANCNSEFRGSGVYGNSFMGKRLASNIEYRLVDTKSKKLKYRRLVSSYASIEFIELAESFKDFSVFSKPMYCLDKTNINSTILEIAKVAPVFTTKGPSVFQSSGIDGFVKDENCVVELQKINMPGFKVALPTPDP